MGSLLKLDGFRKKQGGRTVLIPYRLFYVSRNLEHAFRGRTDNLDAQHKQSGAIKLADRFTRDPNLFSTTLQSLRRIHGNPATWEESWRYAMQDFHSLERGSNLAFVEPYLAGAWSRISNPRTIRLRTRIMVKNMDLEYL